VRLRHVPTIEAGHAGGYAGAGTVQGRRRQPTPLAKKTVLPARAQEHECPTDGISLASGNYVISGNLFRTRDTFRQDIIDNSGLILALARPPLQRCPRLRPPIQ